MVCTTHCDACFGPAADHCYRCAAPYLLQSHSCVDACTDGYYKIFSLCEPCPAACATCVDPQALCTGC